MSCHERMKYILCKAREKTCSNINKQNEEKDIHRNSLHHELYGDNLLTTDRCPQRSFSSQSLGKY